MSGFLSGLKQSRFGSLKEKLAGSLQRSSGKKQSVEDPPTTSEVAAHDIKEESTEQQPIESQTHEESPISEDQTGSERAPQPKPRKKKQGAAKSRQLNDAISAEQSLPDSGNEATARRKKKRPPSTAKSEQSMPEPEQLTSPTPTASPGPSDPSAATPTDELSPLSNGGQEEDETNGRKSRNQNKKSKPKPPKPPRRKRQERDTGTSAVKDDGRILGITIHQTDPDMGLAVDLRQPQVKVSIVDGETGRLAKKFNASRKAVSFYECENKEHPVDFILPIMSHPYPLRATGSLCPQWEETLIVNECFAYLVSPSRPANAYILFFEVLDHLPMNQIQHHPDGWKHIAWAFLQLRQHSKNALNVDNRVRLQLYAYPPAYSQKKGDGGDDVLDLFQWYLKVIEQNEVRRAKRTATAAKTAEDSTTTTVKRSAHVPFISTYPSTLYVTIRPISPPQPASLSESLRSLNAFQPEVAAITFEDMRRVALLREKEISRKRQQLTGNQDSLPDNLLWSKSPHENFRIPNELFATMPAGSRGCFRLKFSPNGRRLACACVGQHVGGVATTVGATATVDNIIQQHHVEIFRFPPAVPTLSPEGDTAGPVEPISAGKTELPITIDEPYAVCVGTTGLIYDLCWSDPVSVVQKQQHRAETAIRGPIVNFESSHDIPNASQFLLVASADCTCRVFDVGEPTKSTQKKGQWQSRNESDAAGGSVSEGSRVRNCRQVACLVHPSLVYCARFHPQMANVVASGCKDGIVRVWNVPALENPTASVAAITPRLRSKRSQLAQPQLILELLEHQAPVNSLSFSSAAASTAITLLTGDAAGRVLAWNAPITSFDLSSGSVRRWNVYASTNCSTLAASDPDVAEETRRKPTEKHVSTNLSPVNWLTWYPKIGLTRSSTGANSSGDMGLSAASRPSKFFAFCRDSSVRLLDLRLLSSGHDHSDRTASTEEQCVFQFYTGSLNMKLHLQGSVTGCGTFVTSGSEDHSLYFWNVLTGEKVARLRNQNIQWPVVAVDCHPLDNFVALSAVGSNQPVLVYRYSATATTATEFSHSVVQSDLVATADPNNPATSLGDQLESKLRQFQARKQFRKERIRKKLESVSKFNELLEAQRQVNDLDNLSSLSPVPPSQPAPSGEAASNWLAVPSSSSQVALDVSLGGTQQLSLLSTPLTGLTPAITLSTVAGDNNTASPDSVGQQIVTAVLQYTAQRSDEISLLLDDRVAVLKVDNVDWMIGQIVWSRQRSNIGKKGYFPSSYVENR